MIDIDKALDFVLSNEGGLEENPKDNGSITNFGISLRFLQNLPNAKIYGFHSSPITAEDIININRDQAKTILKGEFWNHAPFGKINSQNVVNYLFDMCVNMGIAHGIKCLQRACWAVAKSRNLLDDGILGNATIEMTNHCVFYLLPPMRSERAAYYRNRVLHEPDQIEFLQGWLNRTYK